MAQSMTAKAGHEMEVALLVFVRAMSRRLLAASLLLLAFAAAGCRDETRSKLPVGGGPIILISIDTLRADHLPIYGASGVATPNIDALARDAIVFENAYSHVPLTLPSHVSMLTGLLPAEVGVRNNLGYRFDGGKHPTIPSLLKSRGHESGAAVSAYVLRGATGLGEVFDHYDDVMDRASEGGAMGEVQRAGNATVDSALQWVEARAGKPYFFFLHLFEPHAPYAAPEPFRTKYASSPYDGEIAAADAQVGRFLDALRAKGDYERATIILVSDHGEGLGDHGEEQHGIFLYREAIHVPLIVKLPGGDLRGKRVRSPAQLIDLLPTIAEVAGFAVPERVKGESLIALARADASPDRRVFSETMYPRIHLGWSDLASLVDARHHYIDAPRPELYDMATDPRERVNVLADQRRVYASMRNEVATHDRTLAPPSAVDPEEAAKLAALGYLGSSSAASHGPLPDPKDGIGDLERVAQANVMLNEGRFEEAVTILRGILERNASYADAWTILARALDRQGNVGEAIAAYKKAIEVAPMLVPGTALSLAELFMREGRFDDAVAHAELASATHPDAARLLIAQAHLGKRDFAAAERESAALMSDPEKRHDAAVVLAQVRIAQRRPQEALVLLERLEQSFRSGATVPPNFWFARGDALARLNRVPEAEHAFSEEVRLYPRNREAYVRMAVLQMLSGRQADADRTLATMVRINPEASTRELAADTVRAMRRQRGLSNARKGS